MKKKSPSTDKWECSVIICLSDVLCACLTVYLSIGLIQLLFQMSDVRRRLSSDTWSMMIPPPHAVHLTKERITVHINTRQVVNKRTTMADTKSDQGPQIPEIELSITEQATSQLVEDFRFSPSQ